MTMLASELLSIIGAGFWSGVPDSRLRALCDCLMRRYGSCGPRHVIAADEGNACALAAGYHLATGGLPGVYLQNSGEGHILNPLLSLLSDRVYAIPCVFVVGWRGEPGVHDEPQHIHQGEVTLRLLEDAGVACCVLGPESTPADAEAAMAGFRPLLAEGRQAAFVVRKGALRDEGWTYAGQDGLRREDAIRQILRRTGDEPIVSTTGKASRELFELREAAGQDHSRDFLTVGSMGHASSIALGIALQRPGRVWCIDGDGAALMHLGAMAVIGQSGVQNLVHIVLNNAAHETVGGMPTAAGSADLPAVARACGYRTVLTADSAASLDRALGAVDGLTFLEVRCALGARADLGRPTATPRENKLAFCGPLRPLRGVRE